MYNREYAENALKKIARYDHWHTAYLDEDSRFYVRTKRTEYGSSHKTLYGPYSHCDDCYNCVYRRNRARCDYCEIEWIVEDTYERLHVTREYDDDRFYLDEDEFGEYGHSIAVLRTKTYEEYEGVLKAIEEWLKEHP